MVRSLPVICVAALLWCVGGVFAEQEPRPVDTRVRCVLTDQYHPLQNRLGIEQQLRQQGGKHLILVRYEPSHNVLEEWVYNRADIDGAPVVWAREMEDPSRNRRLRDYFRDRRVWLIEPDLDPKTIIPYPDQALK